MFAQGLADLGWQLVASGKTAASLEEQGLEVQERELDRGIAPPEWRLVMATRVNQSP